VYAPKRIQALVQDNAALQGQSVESKQQTAALRSELDFVNKEGVHFAGRCMSEKRALEAQLKAQKKQQQAILMKFQQYQQQVAASNSSNSSENAAISEVQVPVLPGSEQELQLRLKTAQHCTTELQEKLVESQYRLKQALNEKGQMEAQRMRLMQEYTRLQGREMRTEQTAAQQTQKADALLQKVSALEQKLHELQQHGQNQVALGAFTAFVKPSIGSRQYPHSRKVAYKPAVPADVRAGGPPLREYSRRQIGRLKLVSTNKIAKVI